MEIGRDVTSLGGAFLRNSFVIMACVILLILQLRRAAKFLFFTVTGGWAFSMVLKVVFMRPRPTVLPHYTLSDTYSFPSGHTFNSVVVYLSLGLVVSLMISSIYLRAVIAVATFGFLVMIGVSRMMLGVHFPSDIIGGWLGGTGWVCLMFSLYGSRLFQDCKSQCCRLVRQ